MRLRVGYCRVSTTSDEQQQALPVQRSRIEREEPDLILADSESGLTTDRPGYLELRRLVQSSRVSEVIATEFSRLGRDAAESDAFVRLCDQVGTVVRTLAEGRLTMATPEGLLLTRLRGSINEGESMKIRARVQRGLEEGRRMAKPMRKPCWPYRLSADRMRLEPDLEQWQIALAFIEHLRSHGWRTHRALQDWSQPIPLHSCRAVRSWLLNPCIRGGIGYGQRPNHGFEQVVWDRHPALLSHADFAAYQVVAAANRRHWGSNARLPIRALTGRCVCSECGWRLKYISGRTVPSLRCGGPSCSQHYKGTREDLVIGWALEQITEQAAHHLAAAATQDEPPEVVELRRQIQQLEQLQDPDLAPAVNAKRQRLESLLIQPAPDGELLAKLSDPRWTSLATYDEVTAVIQQLVAEIQIARQAPVAIRLNL